MTSSDTSINSSSTLAVNRGHLRTYTPALDQTTCDIVVNGSAKLVQMTALRAREFRVPRKRARELEDVCIK